jgi:hypothetical protein
VILRWHQANTPLLVDGPQITLSAPNTVLRPGDGDRVDSRSATRTGPRIGRSTGPSFGRSVGRPDRPTVSPPFWPVNAPITPDGATRDLVADLCFPSPRARLKAVGKHSILGADQATVERNRRKGTVGKEP